MTITFKTIKENWMILAALFAVFSAGLKMTWTVDALEKRVTAIELRIKVLEDANLIRQGAAEVWKARGLVGPAPAPTSTPR